MSASGLPFRQAMEMLTTDGVSPSGRSDRSDRIDSSEQVSDAELVRRANRVLLDEDIVDIALRDPNSGYPINVDSRDGVGTIANLNMTNREDNRTEQSINTGEIKSGGSCIMLSSDGVVTIECNGKSILKISNDDITIDGDLKISINTLREFIDTINNNFSPGELMNIVNEKIKIRSNEELINKRLGAIEGE